MQKPRDHLQYGESANPGWCVYTSHNEQRGQRELTQFAHQREQL